MIIAAHQPNYLPWLGFFDKILECDIFVIADNIQFERQGFTNRNRIKTYSGIRWITVPIKHIEKSFPINEAKIANNSEKKWAKKHWLELKHNYSKAPFWEKYSSFFDETYNKKWTQLIDLNLHLIKALMKFFNIKKDLIMASSLGVTGGKSELIIAICKALRADTYISGIGGHAYLNLQSFNEEGIKVIFQDFQHPVYPQLHGEFVPNLSVIDYLFCAGGKPWKNANRESKGNGT
jgi:hypothetical protein